MRFCQTNNTFESAILLQRRYVFSSGNCSILSLYEGFHENWWYQLRRICLKSWGVSYLNKVSSLDNSTKISLSLKPIYKWLVLSRVTVSSGLVGRKKTQLIILCPQTDSILHLFVIYFSKVEEVSASVRDSKSTLPTPQANFLKKQFYQLWSIFFFSLFEYRNWIEFYS